MPLLSAGGTVASAWIQSDATEKATKAQTQAIQDALKARRWIYDRQNENLSPFRSSGVAAWNLLGSRMGLPAPDMTPAIGTVAGGRQPMPDATNLGAYPNNSGPRNVPAPYPNIYGRR